MDMPQNQDFKYVLQDFGNIYIGARYSYEEMLKSEEIPYKWKAIIRHYLLKETSPETTMENHIFFICDRISLHIYRRSGLIAERWIMYIDICHHAI